MIDLHIHTNFSDGDKSLEEVLREAERLGLLAISITDHDSIEAYYELEKPEVRKLFSREIITGVEVSATLGGVTVHILGYGIDYKEIEPHLVPFLGEPLVNFAKQYFEDKFAEHGIDVKSAFSKNVDYLGFLGLLIDVIDGLSDGHLLKIDLSPTEKNINKKGVLWWEHLTNSKSPLYMDVSGHVLPVEQAIDLIRKCGGKVILAHPAQYQDKADFVVEALIDKVDGIECYHFSANETYRNKLIELCKQRGLIITGGSDFHGRPNCKLGGENVPDCLLEPLTR